ncbi:unnamed protein product [Chrysoparadoxa australica]
MIPREQKKVSESIVALQMKGDTLTRAMILEQRRVDELDAALKQTAAQINAYRIRTKSGAVDVLNMHRMTANPAHQRADGLNPTKQADQNQRKLVSNLEARHNKLMIRQSEIQNDNNIVREQINHLRKKRLTTNDVHKQYEARLSEIRSEIRRLMEQAAQLNEQRETQVKEREDLIQANMEAEEEHDRQMEEMTDFIEEMASRFEESVLEAAKNVQQKGFGEELSRAGNLTYDEEAEIRRRLAELQEDEAKEHETAKAIERKVAWFQQAFESLKAVSGIDSMDRLIKVFCQQEEETFSLFNYMQSVNQEIDQAVEKSEELAKEIAAYQEKQGREEEQRKATIGALHQMVEKQRKAREDWRKRVEDAKAMMERLGKKVQSIFFKIQCDHFHQHSSFKDAAGKQGPGQGADGMLSGQGITESNILEHMSLVEMRSMQIISAYK